MAALTARFALEAGRVELDPLDVLWNAEMRRLLAPQGIAVVAVVVAATLVGGGVAH
jgi:hypothetical protein